MLHRSCSKFKEEEAEEIICNQRALYSILHRDSGLHLRVGGGGGKLTFSDPSIFVINGHSIVYSNSRVIKRAADGHKPPTPPLQTG
jgi:hypothetical protein